ncbi:hypothetical protein ACF0H5_022769 [Mactra antiquata]
MSTQTSRLAPPNREREPFLDQWKRPEFVCGWGAAFVNISVTFPINKVMFRQQLYGVRTLKAIGQLRKEGLSHIYRGLMPPLLQKTTSMSLMFGLYYEFERDLNSLFPQVWTPVNKSVAAMSAGTVEAILTPFERIQVLMQDRNYHKHYSNTLHAFREIRTNYGIKEFYRGQTAILMRNGPSNVLFFLGRDYLQEIYPPMEMQYEKVLLDFISGACLGAFLSSLFYPVNVVKVRMQSTVGGDFLKFWPTFKVIMEERNYSIKKLFRGLPVNYSRAFISWGIVNATYEFLLKQFNSSENIDSS